MACHAPHYNSKLQRAVDLFVNQLQYDTKHTEITYKEIFEIIKCVNARSIANSSKGRVIGQCDLDTFSHWQSF